jgi:hypothetical protein
MDQIISLQSLATSGNSFSWGNFVGSTDASTLGIIPNSQLPEDIAVTSHITGKTVQFFFKRIEALGLDPRSNTNIAIYEGHGAHLGIMLHVYNA